MKFFKTFSIYTFGQFLTQALSFVLLPIYINQLSKEDYGIVGAFMAIATFLNALMQYGLSPTVMRYYYDYKNDPKKFKSFISTLLLFLFGVNVLIVFLLLLCNQYIFHFVLPDINISDYIFYVIGYSFLFTFPLLNLSLFRVHGEAKKYLYFNVIQFFTSFTIIYFFVVIQKGGALGKIKGEFWARVPLFLWSFYLYSKYFTLKELKMDYIKRAINFGIPLMFQSLLWWGLYRLDYFLITKELGSTALGLYNVAFQISFVVITIGISFSLAWTPHFFSIAEKESTPRLYGTILGNYFMILAVVSVLIYYFGASFLNFIGGEKYLEIFTFLPFLLLGAIFQSSYYLIHQTIQYSKKTWSIPIILCIGVIVGFLMEYMVVKKYELLGLSIVKVFVFIFVFALTFIVGQKHYKINLSKKKIISTILFLLVNFSVGFMFDNNVLSLIIKSIVLIGSLGSLWFVFPFFTNEERVFLINKIKK